MGFNKYIFTVGLNQCVMKFHSNILYIQITIRIKPLFVAITIHKQDGEKCNPFLA